LQRTGTFASYIKRRKHTPQPTHEERRPEATASHGNLTPIRQHPNPTSSLSNPPSKLQIRSTSPHVDLTIHGLVRLVCWSEGWGCVGRRGGDPRASPAAASIGAAVSGPDRAVHLCRNLLTHLPLVGPPIVRHVPSSMVCLLMLQPLSSWLPMVMASMLPGSPSRLHGEQPPLGPSVSQIKALLPHRSFVHHVSFPGWCLLFLLLSSSSMTEAVAPPWLGCLSHLHYFYVGSTF